VGISTLLHCDLVTRVTAALSCSAPLDPGVDGGCWYDLKVKQQRTLSTTSTTPPPFLPNTGWNNISSTGQVPEPFNEGHIYHYIIESLSVTDAPSTPGNDSDCEDSSGQEAGGATAKPLQRGKTYFTSGHVQCITCCCTHDYSFFKCKVRQSMGGGLYSVTATISAKSGFVIDASCECKASGLGRCSHVAGLLFALFDFKQNVVSCTSQTCTWNVGRKRGKNPQKVQEACYASSKVKRKPDALAAFDPRPEQYRQSTASTTETNNFISSLRLGSSPSCMWAQLLSYTYEDYSYDVNDIAVLRSKVQQVIENLHPSTGCGITVPCQHEICCRDITSAAVQVVPEQRSDDWHTARCLRVTASVCHDVNTASDVSAANLVRRMLWNKPISTAAMQYGCENESLALAEFKMKMSFELPGFTAFPTGLWVNLTHPELACSPDGIAVHSGTGEVALIEIKCPYVLKDCSPVAFSQNLSPAQLQKFFLQQDNGKIHLKRTHKYFSQVQMQMAVMAISKLYFIVWSKHGLWWEEIAYDDVFWQARQPKLSQFHHCYLVPEYVEMRLHRSLPLFKLDSAE